MEQDVVDGVRPLEMHRTALVVVLVVLVIATGALLDRLKYAPQVLLLFLIQLL